MTIALVALALIVLWQSLELGRIRRALHELVAHAKQMEQLLGGIQDRLGPDPLDVDAHEEHIAYGLEIEDCPLCDREKRDRERGPKFDNARRAEREIERHQHEMERHRQWIAEYDERKRREADG